MSSDGRQGLNAVNVQFGIVWDCDFLRSLLVRSGPLVLTPWFAAACKQLASCLKLGWKLHAKYLSSLPAPGWKSLDVRCVVRCARAFQVIVCATTRGRAPDGTLPKGNEVLEGSDQW
eukprot:14348729-Alexandrium_andersonii.AAC.1